MKEEIPPAVNWHLEAYCNYDCKFCYAPLLKQRELPKITDNEGVRLIRDLADCGVEKINFVGGEAMLNRNIEQWIINAKLAGLTTSIVSNGTRMTRDWLERMRPHLDWLGLSIDASNDELHALMGRGLKGEINIGKSRHLERSIEVWGHAKEFGYGLKLNTVVTSVNADDDMSDLVSQLMPNRWKICRVLEIKGENDGRVSPLLISSNSFDEYVRRNTNPLEGKGGIEIVAEDNEDMLGSYAMIDPQGKVYTNLYGKYSYSRQSAIEIGFQQAWEQVMQGFSGSIFSNRGGLWDWDIPQGESGSLPILKGN